MNGTKGKVVLTVGSTGSHLRKLEAHFWMSMLASCRMMNILRMKNVTPQTHSPEEFQRIRNHQANGMGGLPLVGDPDSVARDMERLAALGLRGIAVSFVNYLDELPYFCAEVVPRLARSGLRDSRTAGFALS